MSLDVVKHNRTAWDREVEQGNPATVPLPDQLIADARNGQLSLSLTGGRPVPIGWLGQVTDKRLLCLALGGGQQVPLLAAAGARVTALDNSAKQISRDLDTAKRNSLQVDLQLGDMQDLSRFEDCAFEMAIVGLGLQFIPEPEKVWRGLGRVLEPGSTMIAALVNPVQYIFDWKSYSAGVLKVRHALPYSDIQSLSAEERACIFDPMDPIEFGHTLEQLLGSLTEAGFAVTGFMEDSADEELLSKFMATYFVVRARLCRIK